MTNCVRVKFVRLPISYATVIVSDDHGQGLRKAASDDYFWTPRI